VSGAAYAQIDLASRSARNHGFAQNFRAALRPKTGVPHMEENPKPTSFEPPVDVKAAAQFLGVSPSLVYAYVERKQIPHFRMMGRSIRFRLSELDSWRQQFHVNGGIHA
jgi:excisionase family DNA binding protein